MNIYTTVCARHGTCWIVFSQLKRMIWGKRSNSIVNLKKNSGKQILAEIVKSIDRVSVMKIWQHFASVLKQLVGEIDSDLNPNFNFMSSEYSSIWK